MVESSLRNFVRIALWVHKYKAQKASTKQRGLQEHRYEGLKEPVCISERRERPTCVPTVAILHGNSNDHSAETRDQSADAKKYMSM